ncbi:bifunctional nuclease family protein [Brevibacterium litoralis]|uniref:bifunctional nuclease family protein n=1 Tax=Brevibacterium litoralis TaxID=3138935 RepID=UPI0032EE098B
MAPIPVEVVGVRIELPANQHVLLLKAVHRPHYLPVWIGAAEANAIGIAQRGLAPPRPLSHHLMLDILESYGASLDQVVITGREGHSFLAEIRTSDGKTISARPSDAVAMSLIADCPVYAEEELVKTHGIEAPDADEDEVDRFRDFLDHVSPEDFEGS